MINDRVSDVANGRETLGNIGISCTIHRHVTEWGTEKSSMLLTLTQPSVRISLTLVG